MRNALVLALVLSPALARADEEVMTAPEKPAKKVESETTVAASAEATSGVLTGEGTVRDTGGFAQVEASVRPRLDRDRWRFELPIEIADRETFGAAFVERSASVDAVARYKQSKRTKITARAGGAGVSRPDWPDPYQPLLDGSLAPTSRRSHLDVHAGAGVSLRPTKPNHVDVGFELERVDYDDDDNFDPIDEPTHLVPSDHVAAGLDGKWKYWGDGWKAGAGLGLTYKTYSKLYARDAGTGLTHAGAGGTPANPMQQTLILEPSAVYQRELGAAELAVSYGLPIQRDLFEGYYSYVEHHPEIDVELAPGAATVDLAADIRYRTYGSGSYAENPPDHPDLDWGNRRTDLTFGAGADVRLPLAGPLDLVGGAALRIRRTNFPDYQPGVFPDSRMYDIDWDYNDVTAWAGVAWSMDKSSGD